MKQNPKLAQYLEEIEALNEKYQYVITPYLEMNERGIVPAIKVVDKVPPKEKVKK